MKTSNLIITAYAVFIGICITTLCVTAKTHQNSNKEIDLTQYKEIPLKPFSVIKAMKSSNVEVNGNSKFSIKVDRQNTHKPTSTLYKQIADTLYVFGDGDNLIVVECPSLRTVVGLEHNRINIKKTASNQLNFLLHGGITEISNEGIEQKSNSINITATDANVYVWSVNSSQLSLDLKNSHIEVNTSKLEKISGILTTKSILRGANSVGSLNIQCDSTSGFDWINRK